MSNGEDKTIVTIVEPTDAVEPGEHTGTIDETETKHYDADAGWQEVDDPNQAGDAVSYFQVRVTVDDAEGFQLSQSWSLNKGQVSENTGLGAALSRFGVNLQDLGSEVALEDIFYDGRKVRFDVDQEEQDEDDDEGGYLEIVNGSFEPVGDVDEAEQSGPSQPEDADAEIYSVVAGMDDPSEGEVLKELAQTNGALVPRYKEMVQEGEIQVNDGVVSLG